MGMDTCFRRIASARITGRIAPRGSDEAARLNIAEGRVCHVQSQPIAVQYLLSV
jgi:hypothetical protein